MSNFSFLASEWPAISEDATRVEAALKHGRRTACFYAGQTLEVAIRWAFKADASLKLPYDDKLSAVIHEPIFRAIPPETIFNKAGVINRVGNRTVHGSNSIDDTAALEQDIQKGPDELRGRFHD